MLELPLVLLLLLLTAILLRMDLVFYIVYVLAGTYALARWWTARNLPRLRVTRRFTSHIFTGERTTVEIQLENRSWWPIPWLRYEETPPGNLGTAGPLREAITLRPKEKVHLGYELVGQQRGYYQLGPGMLSTGDLFGFAEATGTFGERTPLVVYPRVIPLSRVNLVSRAPYGTIKSRQQIFSDPARITGVRPYQAGDPLRNVDWKSSARAGVLQVKKYEPAVSLTSVLFLDLDGANYSRHLRGTASEWGIVVAASLASYLTIEQRQVVGLASNGIDAPSGARCWTIPPRPGRPHLMKLLEWLARVQLADTTPLAEWLPTATADLPWGTTVIALTPSGDEAICAALHRLRRAGLNPVLMVTEPYARFGIVRERGRQLGIAAYQVASELELKRWQDLRVH